MASESLYKKIRLEVIAWRKADYPSNFEEISQILAYQFHNEDRTQLKYLRKPQFEAIETYLYLRFRKNTVHILDLYKEYYSTSELMTDLVAQELPSEISNILVDKGIDYFFEQVRSNDELVKKHKLENLRESLSLPYPSYILSLVMGAGKTILIGAIIYIEFALSLKTGAEEFLKNALVFAPGKTILGSLKEISQIELEKILPPNFSALVNINVKLTYTQDGQKDIPITKGSNYNIIVTNIEKIRIISKKADPSTLNFQARLRSEERQNTANLRLQTIASLDSLGVFSDEAHNTYGQDLDKGIKKVRQTINYLAEKTSLRVVINTTGTPYFRRRILKDVVFWYGLLEGIEENILKDIRGNNIYSYSEVRSEEFIGQVLDDFFTTYRDIPIEGGYKSKIAMYFPTIEDVRTIRPSIEKQILQYGLDRNCIFEVNSQSSKEDKDIFINRINDNQLPYRIFLLVQMGTEGWNCPSLFSCCLARDLGNSKNFVLQASMRCLRQLPQNTTPARIYLSSANTKILNDQLQENYGENLSSIQASKNNYVERKITLIKYDLPPIKTLRKIRKYTRKDAGEQYIALQKPEPVQAESFRLVKYDFSQVEKGRVRLSEKEIIELKSQVRQEVSLFAASLELASLYGFDYFLVFADLQKYYPDGYLRIEELQAIKLQIEGKLDNYQLEESEVEDWLTVIKKEGFTEEIDENGVKVYTTTILVHREKLDSLIRDRENYDPTSQNLSFHFTPYKFDSQLETSLFNYALEVLQEAAENIEHFLFVGGITDRSKTDLIFEYRDTKGKLRNYTPDFLLIKTNGDIIFMETKGSHLLNDFEIKQLHFEEQLPTEIKFKLFVSENENIYMEDKKWLQENT